MGRGILFGAFWGFLLGALVLAVASLLGEVPGREAPAAKVVEVPAGSQFDQAGVDKPVAPPAEEPPVAPQTDAPLVTAPEAPLAPTLGGEITTSAGVPQAGGATSLSAPPTGASNSGVTLRAEEGPITESPSIETPAPQAEAQPAAETEPAEPIVVPEPVEEVAEEPEPAEPPIEPAITAAPAEPVAPSATENAVLAPLSEEARGTVRAELDTAQVEVPVEEAPAVSPASDEPVTVAEAAPEPAPQASSGGFRNLAEGVTVNRLTDSQVRAEEEAALAESAAERANSGSSDTRPVAQFAQLDGWTGPDDRPLFSLILIDEAGDGALLGALGNFSGPLTFAIPAGSASATDAMQRYRDAGHEVVIVADLPEGALASDIEIAMGGYFQAVPEAVAVLDGTLSGFGGDRDVAGQVAQILASSGHGLVTFAQGLNSAVQISERSGVPTGTVYRDLDGNGQDDTVIRRFLDQAAFRAGQDGHAILLGRMRPETISALLIWHQQDRARRVNLAPLSAVLLANDE
ncbi:MAG: divergent polysaccharide deacetylase family protein [Pseudomonadota bacterium]